MKTCKKGLALFLSLAMIFTMLPFAVFSASAASEEPAVEYTGYFENRALKAGDGTKDDPYIIKTADEFQVFVAEANGSLNDVEFSQNFTQEDKVNLDGNTFKGLYFKLGDDFDNSNQPVKAIIRDFEGNLDGNGKTVTLSIDNTTEANSDCENVGLFGYVGGESVYDENGDWDYDIYATVSNLTTDGSIIIKGASVDTKTEDCPNVGVIGAICATSYVANIKNCHNKANITISGKFSGWYEKGYDSYYQYLGGICGMNSYGTIKKCSNSGNIINKSIMSEKNYQEIGGICGYNYNTVTKCKNSGDITRTFSGKYDESSYVGGICGYSAYWINKSTNTGNILADCETRNTNAYLYATIGGICGYNNGYYGAGIEKCSNSGDVKSSGDLLYVDIGGICGHDYGWGKSNRVYATVIMNCSNDGDVLAMANGTQFVGGLVGYECGMAQKSSNVRLGNFTASEADTEAVLPNGEVTQEEFEAANTGVDTFAEYKLKQVSDEVAEDGYNLIFNCYNSGKIKFKSRKNTSNLLRNFLNANFENSLVVPSEETVVVVNEYIENNRTTVGGLVGSNYYGAVYNCYSSAKIIDTAEADQASIEEQNNYQSSNIGALVGYNYEGATLAVAGEKQAEINIRRANDIFTAVFGEDQNKKTPEVAEEKLEEVSKLNESREEIVQGIKDQIEVLNTTKETNVSSASDTLVYQNINGCCNCFYDCDVCDDCLACSNYDGYAIGSYSGDTDKGTVNLVYFQNVINGIANFQNENYLENLRTYLGTYQTLWGQTTGLPSEYMKGISSKVYAGLKDVFGDDYATVSSYPGTVIFVGTLYNPLLSLLNGDSPLYSRDEQEKIIKAVELIVNYRDSRTIEATTYSSFLEQFSEMMASFYDYYEGYVDDTWAFANNFYYWTLSESQDPAKFANDGYPVFAENDQISDVDIVVNDAIDELNVGDALTKKATKVKVESNVDDNLELTAGVSVKWEEKVAEETEEEETVGPIEEAEGGEVAGGGELNNDVYYSAKATQKKGDDGEKVAECGKTYTGTVSVYLKVSGVVSGSGLHSMIGFDMNNLDVTLTINGKKYDVESIKGMKGTSTSGVYSVIATVSLEKELSHDIKTVAGKSATCTTAGYASCYQCATCNTYFSDANGTLIGDGTESAYETWKTTDGQVKPTGHNYVKKNQVDATCAKNGQKEYYRCSECQACFVADGTEGYKSINLDEWSKDPEGGLIKAHGLIEVGAKPATTTETGHQAYWFCSTCNKYYADNLAKTLIGDATKLSQWVAVGGQGYISNLPKATQTVTVNKTNYATNRTVKVKASATTGVTFAKKSNKNYKVSADGTITFKKRAKVRKYKINVVITAPETNEYSSATTTQVITVTLKKRKKK